MDRKKNHEVQEKEIISLAVGLEKGSKRTRWESKRAERSFAAKDSVSWWASH